MFCEVQNISLTGASYTSFMAVLRQLINHLCEQRFAELKPNVLLMDPEADNIEPPVNQAGPVVQPGAVAPPVPGPGSEPTNPHQFWGLGINTGDLHNREWLDKKTKDMNSCRGKLTRLLAKGVAPREEILEKFQELDTVYRDRRQFLERVTSTEQGFSYYSSYTELKVTKNLLISTANTLGLSNWRI